MRFRSSRSAFTASLTAGDTFRSCKMMTKLEMEQRVQRISDSLLLLYGVVERLATIVERQDKQIEQLIDEAEQSANTHDAVLRYLNRRS